MSEEASEKVTPENEKRIGEGKPGPGRPKGVPNKLTSNAKQLLQAAFEDLGGVERMVKWANEDSKNLGDFYRIWARIIPADVKVEAPQLDDLRPSDPMEIARRMLFMLQLGAKQAVDPPTLN